MIWELVAVELRNILFGFPRTNEHGVEFHFHPVKEIGIELEVVYAIRGISGFVSYSIWYEDVQEFAMDHAVFDEEDLERITADNLFGRFERGQARIFCQVGNDQYLFFQREDVLMYAEDDQDERHLVSDSLVNVEDYVRYTRQYYARKVNP